MRDTSNQISLEIKALLSKFNGEESLKKIFWELLSYDRVRDRLPLSLLPPSASHFILSLEVFAESDAFSVVLVAVSRVPTDGTLEGAIWAVKRSIPNCIVLLNHAEMWWIVYPDEIHKPRVRMLALPGAADRRDEIVKALCALNAVDGDSGEELSPMELTEGLDEFFPGATPSIGDVMTDFDRITQHPNEEMRELWPFIRAAGQYPLLTETQERGEDLRGDEAAPDGSGLPYRQWRLVVHNLRLVVWVAKRVPRVGITLADLVQEGCIGLMIAAERFEPERGFRFTTYAVWWIKQSAYRALHNQCNLMRWPVHRSETLLPALIRGKEIGCRPGEKRTRQLDGRMHKWMWRLSRTGANPVDVVMRQQARKAIEDAILRLKPKERPVIEGRFGLIDGDEQTLDSIGQGMNVTRERIRQIEEKALIKLGHPRQEALRVNWSALEWRRTCAPGGGTIAAPAPFHDLAVSANDLQREG